MNRRVAVVAVVLLAAACGGTDAEMTSPSPLVSAPESASTQPGEGGEVRGAALSEPPLVDGVITGEQAAGVTRAVVEAWIRDDRAAAEVFMADAADLDELFASPAPSDRIDEDEGEPSNYCSGSDDEGYSGCSYTLLDDSEDGILALGFSVGDVDGRVMVTSGGAADWND